MSLTIEQSLDQFIEQFITGITSNGHSLTTEYEPDWPSPCYQFKDSDTPLDGDIVNWRPVRQQPGNSFAQLEQALGLTLDQQYCTFFTRYYSFNLPADAKQGPCELLQVVSKKDFERLQENVVGHVLMKRRLRLPETLFFGLTDDDDLILSIKNDTGEVLLEKVGKKQFEVLAPDLASFVSTMMPAV